MFSIIPLKQEHVDKLIELENECFSIPWTIRMFEDELESPIATYYVAMLEDELVGYVGMWQILDEGHVTNIAVKKKYRRKGVASLLLDKIIEVADGYPLTMLTLEVRRSNEPAKSLYAKYGFVEEGLRIGYYADNNEDAIIMTRREQIHESSDI